jgi:hypothetical protein
MTDTRKYDEHLGQYFDKALEMAKDLEVKIIFGRPPYPYSSEKCCGVYLSETKTIWINTEVYNIARPTKDMIHTIVHELVHAVQHILEAYEFFKLPDDLEKIKANELWKQTVMDDAPIFEVEADDLANKICSSWGMPYSMYIYGTYSMKKRTNSKPDFLNFMWNEVYRLDVEMPKEEIKEAA